MWSGGVRKQVVEIRLLLQLDLLISLFLPRLSNCCGNKIWGMRHMEYVGGSSMWPSVVFPACLSRLSREQIARVRWCVLWSVLAFRPALEEGIRLATRA